MSDSEIEQLRRDLELMKRDLEELKNRVKVNERLHSERLAYISIIIALLVSLIWSLIT